MCLVFLTPLRHFSSQISTLVVISEATVFCRQIGNILLTYPLTLATVILGKNHPAPSVVM